MFVLICLQYRDTQFGFPGLNSSSLVQFELKHELNGVTWIETNNTLLKSKVIEFCWIIQVSFELWFLYPALHRILVHRYDLNLYN